MGIPAYDEGVVVIGSSDGVELLGLRCGFEHLFPQGEWDYIILVAMQNKDGLPDLFDLSQDVVFGSQEWANGQEGEDLFSHLADGTKG